MICPPKWSAPATAPANPAPPPVWQVLHDHAAKLPSLHPDAAAAVTAFLDCGDLHAGFTCLHCPDCDHEFLFAFSCKGFRAARKPTRRALSCRPHRNLRPEATGQGLLFDDDCSQPDSADAEPVFWTGGAEQAGRADDFVQADVLGSD